MRVHGGASTNAGGSGGMTAGAGAGGWGRQSDVSWATAWSDVGLDSVSGTRPWDAMSVDIGWITVVVDNRTKTRRWREEAER